MYEKYEHYHGTEYCDACDEKKKETVTHYLMECKKYENKRNVLRNNLIEIDNFYKNKINWNIRNILFPHYWQVQPEIMDKKYKEKYKNNLKKRVKIIKTICEFVKVTERFESEWGL